MMHISNLCRTKHHKRLIARQIISAWPNALKRYIYLDGLLPERALILRPFHALSRFSIQHIRSLLVY